MLRLSDAKAGSALSIWLRTATKPLMQCVTLLKISLASASSNLAMTNRPTAPANRSDLKTWTIDQLTYAAPFWVAKLEAYLIDDESLCSSCPPNSQLLVDALKMRDTHRQQLRFWKLILSDKIRVLPPSLRTFYREGSWNECGLDRRSCIVGRWDKAQGIWPK